ncbi:MAG: hypothetical protein Unbinned1469contig1000_31 [Prokaryotic dsDNA virus sp.]|jgi:glycine cleavage system protein P-like pyridoxal-binding family|nr:MAG: hypothetical protein Unbinned1469contig1000_31 [Prokaryotic dsDNA virus sp.]|tara:strand:- start:121 stop:387 length:267 start_codon:yes stop_codon:yes gene_type:complete
MTYLATATPINETESAMKTGLEVNEVDALRYVLELEGEICSLDKTFSINLRNCVYKLKQKTVMEIFKEECFCGASTRKHQKYVYDWAS